MIVPDSLIHAVLLTPEEKAWRALQTVRAEMRDRQGFGGEWPKPVVRL
jgi:hypothetical protein